MQNRLLQTQIKFADATHNTVHDTQNGLQKLSTCKAVVYIAVHPEVLMLITLGLYASCIQRGLPGRAACPCFALFGHCRGAPKHCYMIHD